MENKKEYLKMMFNSEPDRVDRNKLESPLEKIFVEYIEKHIDGKTKVYPQYNVRTDWGTFRIDFVIEYLNKKIGIECDGEEFHDEWRDEFRDSLILGSGDIDEIYRFRGKDLFLFLDDCIYIIFKSHENMFSDRYREIFSSLTSETIKKTIFELERIRVVYNYMKEIDEGSQSKFILVEKRDRKNPGFWKNLYQFSLNHKNKNLDHLLKLFEIEKSLKFPTP